MDVLLYGLVWEDLFTTLHRAFRNRRIVFAKEQLWKMIIKYLSDCQQILTADGEINWILCCNAMICRRSVEHSILQ